MSSVGPSRSSSGIRCSRSWVIASSRCAPATQEPACTTTPRAPIAAPRAREWATASTDLRSVASVGEPKLTRYGAWTNTGIPASSQRPRNSSSFAGSPGDNAHPRGFETNTWTAAAPISSAYASAFSHPPATGTWEPTGEGLRGGTHAACQMPSDHVDGDRAPALGLGPGAGVRGVDLL